MRVKLKDIFFLFLKVSCMIFGGGIVILPLLEQEAVKKRGWVTKEELVEYYAVSQVIPGINIPDVAMFIGYKLRGKSGAVAACLGLVIFPFIIMLSLALFLNAIIHNGFVKSAFWGLELGTIIILINAVRMIWKNSIVDRFTFLFFILILLVSVFTDLSPFWIVLTAVIFGIIKGFLTKESVVE